MEHKTDHPIKVARMRCGLTQDGLSKLLGIPRRTIENWEMGARKCPDYVEQLIVERLEHIAVRDTLDKLIAEIQEKTISVDEARRRAGIAISDLFDGLE